MSTAAAAAAGDQPAPAWPPPADIWAALAFIEKLKRESHARSPDQPAAAETQQQQDPPVPPPPMPSPAPAAIPLPPSSNAPTPPPSSARVAPNAPSAPRAAQQQQQHSTEKKLKYEFEMDGRRGSIRRHRPRQAYDARSDPQLVCHEAAHKLCSKIVRHFGLSGEW